jgi:hypothetical protein
MFFRSKPVGSYRYLQIVHSVREGKKVRQQVIATLGRLDLLEASGQLERLMRNYGYAPIHIDENSHVCKCGCSSIRLHADKGVWGATEQRGTEKAVKE